MTRLVLGVYEIRERAQLLQLVLVLVHFNQRAVVVADSVKRLLEGTAIDKAAIALKKRNKMPTLYTR